MRRGTCALSLIVPHWSWGPDADQMLQECVQSFAPYAEEIIVAAEPPGADGSSSIVRNINTGLRCAGGKFLFVVGNDVIVDSGERLPWDLCRPGVVMSPVLNGVEQSFQGPAFCLPRDVYQRVGGLDEQFTGYMEDEDYALRLVGAGIPLQCATSWRLLHRQGGGHSMRRLEAERLMEENRTRFIAKWGSPPEELRERWLT